jgi:hypothetical protein
MRFSGPVIRQLRGETALFIRRRQKPPKARAAQTSALPMTI